MNWTSIVTVKCDTREQAETVLTERVGHDEDYGFDYTIDRTSAWQDLPTRDYASAERYLGFALFNLNKRNYSATETLLRKAFKELVGEEWDGQEESDGGES
jgi:hypothetical protein